MVLHKIKDKWKRNVAIYKDAYKKGKIAGFDYTLLLWKLHTKFLLRIRNSKDRQKNLSVLKSFGKVLLMLYINIKISLFIHNLICLTMTQNRLFGFIGMMCPICLKW